MVENENEEGEQEEVEDEEEGGLSGREKARGGDEEDPEPEETARE